MSSVSVRVIRLYEMVEAAIGPVSRNNSRKGLCFQDSDMMADS
jgi:hypothetical protein